MICNGKRQTVKNTYNKQHKAYLFPQCFNSQQTIQDPTQPLQPQIMLCSPKHNQVYEPPDNPDNDPMVRNVGIYNKKSKKTKQQFDQHVEVRKRYCNINEPNKY